MKLRFFNTYEPVVPLYRDLLPALASSGHEVEAIMAAQDYRLPHRTARTHRLSFTRLPTLGPRYLPHFVRKGLISATYTLTSGSYSLVGSGDWLNIFLTQPPLFHTWGNVLKRLRHQPYCCVLMDLYPWVAMEAGMMPSSGWIADRAVQMARQALLNANGLIAIGRCMARRLDQMGIPGERIRVIPNWADPHAIQPIPPEENQLRKALGYRDDQFVITYSGNLGISHYFDDLIEVAQRLRSRQDVAFLVIGGGARLAEIRRSIERRALSSFTFLDFQPHDKLSESLCVGDVHFVSLREAFTGLVVPSKTYGALAAGRPVIYQGFAESEIGSVVADEKVGLVVRIGDVNALESAVVQLADDRAEREAMGRRARTIAANRYSTETMLADYLRALEDFHP